MQRRSRLSVMAIGALTGAALLGSRDAAADLFGGDVAVLSQILIQAIEQTAALGKELTQLEFEVQLMRTLLSSLDAGSYDGVQRLLTGTSANYGSLTQDITALGYTLDAVNRDYRTVYPSDFRTAPAASFDGTSNRWQTEILSAALVAARAQGSLAALQANTDEAVAILQASRAANGDVAQLQAAVQMLGVMQGQLNTLIQALVTTGRVEADVAAATASEKQLSREKRQRNLDGYTDRGAPVQVMSSLPPIAMP